MEVFIVGALTVAWFAFTFLKANGVTLPKPHLKVPDAPGACRDFDSVSCLVQHLDPKEDAQLIRTLVQAVVTASLPEQVQQALRDQGGAK